MIKKNLPDTNTVKFQISVKLQIEFNPANVVGFRLIGYENSLLADELAKASKGKDDKGYRSEFIRLVKLAGILNSYYLMNIQ